MGNGEKLEGDGGIVTGIALDEGSTDSPAQPSADPGIALDLAAWGRGEQNYAFDEVKKAIDDWTFDKVRSLADRVVAIEDPRDALEYLIDEGVIDEDEARTDVEDD
jgi:hypothetical protein